MCHVYIYMYKLFIVRTGVAGWFGDLRADMFNFSTISPGVRNVHTKRWRAQFMPHIYDTFK